MEPSPKKLKLGSDDSLPLWSSSSSSGGTSSFESILLNAVLQNEVTLDYSMLKKSRKYEIKNDFKDALDMLFRQYKMENEADCVDCLRYVEKYLLNSQPGEVPSQDEVMEKQMSALTLPQRNELIRLLTHQRDQVNTEMIALFPSLRKRSERLLKSVDRKPRSDKIDLKFISDFMHGHCRVNTFGNKIKVGKDKFHPVHEYCDSLKNIYQDDFKNSIEFQEFVERTGITTVSYGKFVEGALSCPCIREPVWRVCVDEVETGFNEIVTTLNNTRKSNRSKRKPTCICSFYVTQAIEKVNHAAGEYIHPLSSGVMLLKHLMCERMTFPSKERPGVGRPKIFRKDCCFENCDRCKTFLTSDQCVLNCPSLFNENITYKWRQYTNVVLDNGNELRELKEVVGTLAELRETLCAQLARYKKHYFQYKWLNLCRKEDIVNLGPHTIFIQTDYSAQPTLDSQDKLNSVGHGVCVLSCWVILHSPRLEYYTNEDGVRIRYTFYECDHVRVVTPSTGKQKDQDWFLHCKIFEQLIQRYKYKIPKLNTIIIWTDGAPNQYKCRYNFYWLAQAHNKFGVKIYHRFGATAQFKGVHDKIGQVAKWTVKTKERLGVVRVSTAYEFFNAVNDHLEFTSSNYESRAMPTFEATGYELYYYAADEADEAGKSMVSFTLDRDTMWDCNAVKGSATAYEFIGLPKCGDDFLLLKRTLPCPCENCYSRRYGDCAFVDITGEFDIHTMKLTQPTNCPDMLTVPLENYTIKVLKSFIRLRSGKNAKQGATKPELIKFIVDNYRLYIDYSEVA